LTGRGIKQIILEWILKKHGGKAQTELIRSRIGPTVRLLQRPLVPQTVGNLTT